MISMTPRRNLLSSTFATVALGSMAISSRAVAASTAGDITRDSDEALQILTRSNSFANAVAKQAIAVLVFPSIIKAGLIFGAAFGEGELKQAGKPVGFYNSFSGTFGLQAGAQSYGYAVFLMNEKAVRYIIDTAGWEIGVGPTVVMVTEGVAKNLSTSTLKDDAYAFVFDQKGLMIGISIEGTKITRVSK
ncbi:MAG: lipid-binding SYLF domain-containing protein [Acetobacteraceae bacterium]|nr:lipid-binding SYLF domain-containing protein [Acetobacteraceae bacterium]